MAQVKISSKQQQLARAKRIATLWLFGAAGLFLLLTLAEYRQWLVPWPVWAGLLKMASEAALVGGLADWFAVTALFKPIPPKFPIPHTNIVARNKDSVADNLALFVKDKFFNEKAIETLIKDSQPAQGVSQWLQQKSHADKLSRFLAGMINGVVSVIDDKPVKNLLENGFRRAVNKMDFAPLAAGVMRVLTRQERHQEVLDQLLGKIAEVAQRPESQAFIAEKLYWWLKIEHRRLEKILPSHWLSEQGADIASKALVSIIDDVAQDATHPVRNAFNDYLSDFIIRMETDPAMGAKLEEMKGKLLDNQALQQYLFKIWEDIRAWLTADIQSTEGRFVPRLSHALSELGKTIETDPSLAKAINQHLSEAGRYMAPQLADFLTDHIRKTIMAWDEEEMAKQIELNIGKDLQKVRINGTLVGGLIGAILFSIEHLISRF